MVTFNAHIDGSIKDVRLVRNKFVRGRENIAHFTHINVWHAYGEARESAKYFAGLTSETSTIPYVSDMGPMFGRIVGMQPPDRTRGWRIDFDDGTRGWRIEIDRPKLLHVNWWAHSDDPHRRDKSLI